ncbi:MAG: M23 family metallopeptidase, partial [Byssovorax sp.]
MENAVPPSSPEGAEHAPPSEDREEDVSPQEKAFSSRDAGIESPAREVAAPTPRPAPPRPGTPRPGLTGAILGPLPTNMRVTPAPTTTRTAPTPMPPSIQRREGAPAAPRPSLAGRGPQITTPPEPKRPKRVAIPGPWRISELEKDSSILVESGTMDRKSLLEVLGDKGVPKAQVYQIMKAFDGARKFEKSDRKERFTVAIERTSKRVKAFEYEVTAGEIWQSREGGDGLLSPGAKLDMKIAEGEVQGAFYVGSDLAAAIRDGGFEDGLATTLDEALAGHMSTEGFEEGGTVRVIATEETALGLFSRYKRVIAMEYRPADPAGKPVRVYTFNGQEARGYWDDRGKQPNAGGWRKPVPGAPITSRFNPKRLHPVLHTVMPHTGTDFGAPTGTPIYAAFRGVIESAGPAGACGNAVQIQHPNGINTGYCHMSRFANIKVGEHVGTHQLIGYVGTTGRSTGPHLHFFAKKNGVFFDAETLQLDGARALPGVDREAFAAAKAELDKRLDAITLPEPP